MAQKEESSEPQTKVDEKLSGTLWDNACFHFTPSPIPECKQLSPVFCVSDFLFFLFLEMIF